MCVCGVLSLSVYLLSISTYIYIYLYAYIHAYIHTLHYITLHYITLHYITLHTYIQTDRHTYIHTHATLRYMT